MRYCYFTLPAYCLQNLLLLRFQTDAVRESLKNVLLVMYTGTHDSPPILMRDAPPNAPEAVLWDLTSKQLSSFLPELLDQLFPPTPPAPPPPLAPPPVPAPTPVSTDSFAPVVSESSALPTFVSTPIPKSDELTVPQPPTPLSFTVDVAQNPETTLLAVHGQDPKPLQSAAKLFAAPGK